MILPSIPMKEGERYSPKVKQQTLSRLTAIPAFKFVNVDYLPSSRSDSLLEVHIYLSPYQQHRITGEVGIALHSNAFIGPEMALTYQNRNLFGHAENLKLEMEGSFNVGLTEASASYRDINTGFEFSRPGLFIPFRRNGWASRMQEAKSQMSMRYDRQIVAFPLRPLRDSLTSFGLMELQGILERDSSAKSAISVDRVEWESNYTWRRNATISHRYKPMTLDFILPQFSQDELKSFLLKFNEVENGSQLNFERMLVFNTEYSIAFKTPRPQGKKHLFFNQITGQFSANKLLRYGSQGMRRNFESQYFKFENDFRYQWNFGPKQVLATRLAFMTALPVNKRVALPILDLYSVGGANDIRAFVPRSVGPGTSKPNESFYNYLGVGDLKLVSSIEVRSVLYKYLEVALFWDMGNVWANFGTREQSQQPFRFSQFYKELALGTGLGFRFNFDVIVMRLDFAVPLTKPWRAEGKRWVGDEIEVGNGVLWKDILLYYFVVGYPF